MSILRPPRLKKGDLIGLVSPASTPLPLKKIEGSVRYLESRGYRVEVGKHAASIHGYLAGTDNERAEDFNRFVRDPKVKAVLALRGGYGTPRILPLIDYAALRRHPKIISGFSDITALQMAIWRKCRLVTFSGPMPAVEFWDNPDPYTEENFWPLLCSTRVRKLRNPEENPPAWMRQGALEGTLLGGNLSLLVSSVGTPFLPSMKGALLALEEVDENPYRVDRMLMQLRNSGIFSRMSGLLLGQFTHCEHKDKTKPSLSLRQVLEECLHWTEAPILSNLQYGHIPKKLTLPFGLPARVVKDEIKLPESAVL